MVARLSVMLRVSLAACLAVFTGVATAGYAQVSPPPGFSSVGGMSQMNVGVAANASVAGQTVATNASLNIGGRAVTVPASMRMAANAPRIAAGLIFANPYLRAGVAIAGWLGAAGLVYNVANGVWEKLFDEDSFDKSDGYYWRLVTSPSVLYLTPELACEAYVNPNYDLVKVPGSICKYYMYVKSNGSLFGTTKELVEKAGVSNCPAGWYVTPAGCVQAPQPVQVGEVEFLDSLAPGESPAWPMPDGVPAELPSPLPVMPPVVNPEPNPEPGTQPRPVPFFVPTGDPIPNPSYNPEDPPSPNNQPFTQPGVRVNPSPTPDNPWRVDIQPVNRPSESPNPQPEFQPETGGSENSNDKPREDDRGLCDLYPDILACQKLEMPEEIKLNTKEIDFDFQVEGGFNGLASCPAPYTVSLDGNNYEFSFQPFCDQLDLARNLFLAMAWLSAAYILLGARSE